MICWPHWWLYCQTTSQHHEDWRPTCLPPQGQTTPDLHTDRQTTHIDRQTDIESHSSSKHHSATAVSCQCEVNCKISPSLINYRPRYISADTSTTATPRHAVFTQLQINSRPTCYVANVLLITRGFDNQILLTVMWLGFFHANIYIFSHRKR